VTAIVQRFDDVAANHSCAASYDNHVVTFNVVG